MHEAEIFETKQHRRCFVYHNQVSSHQEARPLLKETKLWSTPDDEWVEKEGLARQSEGKKNSCGHP